MAKYELSLTSGNVFSTPVTLTVTPTEGPSVTVSGSSAISTPVELAVLNSIGPRGETGPQGPQGPQGIQGSPGDSVNLQIFDGNIAVGQSVLTTDDVTFNSVTTTGDVTVGGILTAAVSGPFVGDVTVEAGDTLDVSAGTLTLADNQISGDKVEGGTIDAITINTLTSTSISGDLTGDVTGDVTGNLTGNVTGNVTGDVTGNLTGNVTGNVTGDLTGNADTADALTFIVRNSTGATLTKGTAVYVSGIQGNTPEVSPARADSSATMPAFGLVQADIAASGDGVVTTFGSLLGLSVANFGETGVTFSLGDTVYISATEAGKLTNAAPAGEANSIQNIGKIERAAPTTNMTIKVGGAGRTNATPNLDDGDIFIGNSSNQAVTSDLNSEVRSRVSASGDLSYNQATGDFSFTERTDAEVRGLISSTDNGGDGSLSYDSATGVISYTGPDASEVRAHFSGGTGVTITNGEVAIGQPVATTDDVTFDDVTLTGQLKGPATFTIDPAAHGDDTGTVVVAGNLQVDGTTTTINSTIVEIDDLNLKLAAEATTNAQANGAGITVGDGLANITYNSGTDRWVLDKELSADVVGTVSGDVTGNVTGNLTGNVTGTVSTLTNHDTDDLAEGTTNLYYTSARANTDFDTRLATKTTSDLTEGTNLYYTDARDTANFNANLAASDTGDLAEGTNLYYTDARADARVNLQTGTNLDLSNKTTSDLAEGTNLYYTATRFDTAFGAKDTDSLSEGTTNLYYTDGRAQAAISTDSTLSYSSGVVGMPNTGVTAATYGSASQVPVIVVDAQGRITSASQTNVAGVTDFDYNTLTGVLDIDTADGGNFAATVTLDPFDTDDLSEGSTNQYYTDARSRAAISVTDAGGDGSLAYNGTTGVITYTGPSAAEVQNHFTGGTGVTITNGEVAIGQDVATTATPNFAGATLSSALNINHTSTSDASLKIVSTETSSSASPIIELCKDSTSPADGDYLGQIKFTGENDVGQRVIYSKITGKTSDVTDTTEDGLLEFMVRADGSNLIAARLTPDALKLINGTGLEVAGDATISGDLTINGALTTVDTTNLAVTDSLIELSSGLTAGALNDAGLVIERGTSGDNAFIGWDESEDKFTLGTTTATGTSTGNLTVTTGTLVADIEGDVTSTGTSTFSTVDINGGNIDGATIATSDITVGTGKTLDVSGGTLTLADDQISGNKIEGGTIGSVAITTADINGGYIDGTVIGATTKAAISGTIGQFDTSLNVTGTITADGLTVDGDVLLSDGGNYTDQTVKISTAAATVGNKSILAFADQRGTETAKIIGYNSAFGSGLDKVIEINVDGLTSARFYDGGDISFYEDTGTTAKFFWDASAESLGIGNTNPQTALDVTGTVTADTFSFANWTVTESGGSLYFATGGTNKMKLDASGNLDVVGSVNANATIS